ncbi:phage tail-collar fiber domain-containing protein [Bacillus solitudinis]|uniref:phage tail-collar fiber domain-containing protein n=1 Tax=Bacillus solitudinis TaxID=2014074 RepID=UPI000C242621|nr:phage tail protein [Bacillus solitudinis]
MSTFGGLTLTNKGKTLQSKAQTGVQLNYTRIVLGDGELGSSSILELNALKNEKKSLDITKLKILSGGRAVVGAVLSNQEMTEGFYWREIGVFAQDSDAGEVLYCYANAGALAEYIPAGGGSDIIEKNIDVQTLVGNAENVTATIDSSLVFMTIKDLERRINQTDETTGVLYKLGFDNGKLFFEEVN